MKTIFEQLIIDFHGSKIPQPSKRELVLPSLHKNVRKAYVFIGMRRSGKTWAMYQLMQILLNKGINKEKIIYINFEDDRLLSMQAKDFQAIIEAYFELYPKYSKNSDLHFFFDEIHEVKGWEQFIRRLLDQEKMNIYISGSSSKMLGKEIATTLRGRTIIQEIFPFNFREYLYFHNISFKKRLTTKEKAGIAHHVKKFLQYGGFPEAIAMDRKFHRDLLQGYIDIVIYRDIVERYNISNTHMVRELLNYCLRNSSSLISINKIYNIFKSQSKTIGKNSLYEFIEYLEDAYCIFIVPLYTFSLNKQSINPKKIYTVDQGFITAYTIKPEFEYASRLENAVFCNLRRKTENVFYYKTKTGKEVDFLIIMPDNTKNLYQVCVSLSDHETFQREVTALTQAMEELNIKKGTILTMSDKKDITIGELIIFCIPVWQWFCQVKKD